MNTPPKAGEVGYLRSRAEREDCQRCGRKVPPRRRDTGFCSGKCYEEKRLADRFEREDAENPGDPDEELLKLRRAITAACKIIELGDQRLLASDGPAGGQPPDLTLDEWRKLYVILDEARKP